RPPRARHRLGGEQGPPAPRSPPPRGRVMTAVALVPDLMDRSRVGAALDDVAFVGDVDALVAAAAGARLVVVDLSRPGVTAALPAPVATGARVVGFAAHVDRATLDAAAAAGCEVWPRSRFFRALADGDLAGPPPGRPGDGAAT